jgi:uncharacterized protein
MLRPLLVLLLACPLAVLAAEPVHGGPVIDMHLHAFEVGLPPGTPICPGDQRVLFPALDPRDALDFSMFLTCDKPIFSTKDAADHRDRTLAELRKHDVRRAMTDGPVELVTEWRKAAGDDPILLPGQSFSSRGQSIDELRRLHAAGKLAVLGETGIQYRGLRPDDPIYEPYFALAEELDIPVGIHLGEGPPGAARFPGYESYRVDMGQPLLLEDVLRKHPKLRIYVMHFGGASFVDQMIAMMFTYPNLHVDVAFQDWFVPRARFHGALKRMVDAGMEKRILFGSDQMSWPDAIGEAIKSIETAPFLSAGQKRDILYNNAARFLRLTPEQVAADHRLIPREASR